MKTISILLFPLVVAAFSGGCQRHDEAGHAEAPQPADPHGEHHEEVTLTAEAVQKHGVQVATARKQVLTPTFIAPARISLNADAIAHVGSLLSGRIVDIKVKRGDTVRKGDELLVVESANLGEAQIDCLQKRDAVAIATPAVELALSGWDRGKKLLEESQGITLTELQKREGEYKAALGALKSAESIATAAENRLHLLGMDQRAVETLLKSREITPRHPIVAPIPGQVIEREVTLGEMVSPEREALLILADISTLWVLADVPESRLHQLAIGAKASVTIPSFPGRELQGAVTFIAPTLDPNTRTVSVRIEVKGDGLRPGMFAQADIEESVAADAKRLPILAIPEEATQLVEGEIVVFVPVEGEENTFTTRPVKVGPAVGKLLPLLSGLKEGEPFVASGSFILKAEHGKGSAEHDH